MKTFKPGDRVRILVDHGQGLRGTIIGDSNVISGNEIDAFVPVRH